MSEADMQVAAGLIVGMLAFVCLVMIRVELTLRRIADKLEGK